MHYVVNFQVNKIQPKKHWFENITMDFFQGSARVNKSAKSVMVRSWSVYVSLIGYFYPTFGKKCDSLRSFCILLHLRQTCEFSRIPNPFIPIRVKKGIARVLHHVIVKTCTKMIAFSCSFHVSVRSCH